MGIIGGEEVTFEGQISFCLPSKSGGWKKLAFKPLIARVLTAAVTNRMLKIIPKQPSAKLKHHTTPFVGGFFIANHMKQGYAYVTGTRVIPPINTDRLGKNGKVTAIKNVNPPKNIRKHVLTNLGHL
ncbi:hypothetical protein Lal_00034556 [Lupinus albus]|nr:hypothetical protein Lal_00034556 [Lupinus albus]